MRSRNTELGRDVHNLFSYVLSRLQDTSGFSFGDLLPGDCARVPHLLFLVSRKVEELDPFLTWPSREVPETDGESPGLWCLIL